MRAAIIVGVIFVASARVGADEADRVLGMALAEAQLGHCQEALAHLDQYLAATANPSPDAFEVLRRCPRSKAPPTPAPTPAAPAPASAAPPPAAAPPTSPHKRARLFLIDVELGLSVPLLAPEAQFLGTLELGVALSNRLGLDLVLLFESLVSRADVGPGGAFVDVYSANIVVGVEERRVVWHKLSVFGTAAGGILVDSYKGFEHGGALHLDAGVGWTLGPGDIRVRPADFALFFSDAVGVAWRATAGYAFRF